MKLSISRPVAATCFIFLFTTASCALDDFTLGALRRNGHDRTSFSPVGDVVLAPCQGFTFSSGKVCCEFREIPDDIESGDVLTIRYGDDSTLLHEVRSGNRLIEAEVETIDLLEGDYPLISVDSNIIFGLLEINEQLNLFAKFAFSPSRSLQPHPFSCSGTVESWLIGGIPIGNSGNKFTFNLFRRNSTTVFIVAQATIGLSDITATAFPNVYRINNGDSSFAIEQGDFVVISYDRTQSANQFNLSYIDFEDSEVLHNSIFTGFPTDFPLLSLVMSGGDCDGNIYYNLETLANRALLIQDILFPPLGDIPLNDGRLLSGYLYILPNVSFTEGGSIFRWRFAARVNASISLDAIVQYTALQIWRQVERSFVLVASTNISSEPTLQLGALNVYSYDVNLTYQAGDVIALYQPPVESCKYLLTFVDSSNYAEPSLAYERRANPVELATFTSLEVLSAHTVEPLISILSTSMPNDSFTTRTLGNIPLDITEIPTSAATTSTFQVPLLNTTLSVDSEVASRGQSLLIPIVVSIIAGFLLVTVIALVLALCFTRRQYKRSIKKRFEGNSKRAMTTATREHDLSMQTNVAYGTHRDTENHPQSMEPYYCSITDPAVQQVVDSAGAVSELEVSYIDYL